MAINATLNNTALERSGNKVKTVRFDDIIGHFIIPGYQRGYKWRDSDVEFLINDIADIDENYNGDYCLQPIVVADANEVSEDGRKKYILVDGQQRLTTMLLISYCFEHKLPYTLHYDTRQESNDFLEDFFGLKPKPIIKKTCDVYYFQQAIQKIESLIDKKESFIKNLHDRTVLIWYEVDKEQGPKKFEELNSRKIRLSNTELVKALILTKTKRSRTRIANEWNDIEYRLNDERLFSFICPPNSDYNKTSTKIELILDVLANVRLVVKHGKNGDAETFKRIENLTKENGADHVWKRISALFHLIESWYRIPLLYNVIGFMTNAKGTDFLIDLFEQYSDEKNIPTLRTFEEYVVNSLRKYLNQRSGKKNVSEWIMELSYKDEDTFNILLLYNILSMMAIKEDICLADPLVLPDKHYVFHDKFHFELFKNNSWDKEHIHATASEVIQNPEERLQWICDLDFEAIEDAMAQVKETEEDPMLKTFIERARNIQDIMRDSNDENKKSKFKEELKKDEFSELYKRIVTVLDGNIMDKKEREQNSIGNLALLDAGTNRSYKAAPFSTKRKKIITRVKEGIFVPVATQNTFMKLYTEHPGQFYHWTKGKDTYLGNTKSDCEFALDNMVRTISAIWK